MTTILALDAAWTTTQPTGVALAAARESGWQIVAVAPSYDAFVELAAGTPVDWNQRRFTGSAPSVPALLSAAESLAGSAVDLVTIDMPVSTVSICGRRAADNVVSREFGDRGCATHSPSATRPGPLGEALSAGFDAAGFPVAGANVRVATTRHLLEVYPHPALLVLLDSEYRIQYKVAKARRYWAGKSRSERVVALLQEFARIHDALEETFGPLGVPLPAAEDGGSLSGLKRYEDALDAVVCAWVGVRYLEGAARALGDDTAAIWCPC